MMSTQMAEFNSIETVAGKIKENLDSDANKKQISILYAFNSTGKTRLSTAFTGLANDDKVLCYNAFVEDLFKWDNENYILTLDPKSWIVELIKEQGIEKNISDNFSKIINSKIEPEFNLSKGEITFNIVSGDDDAKSNIKISKGEESMFIWSIFYTLLETAIEELNITEEGNRSTERFNELEYVIIDDPVSSIDDNRIITMTLELIEIIKGSNNNKLKFLITTHHALFYNILFNSFKKNKEYKYILSKDGTKLKLENKDDSPFGYHFLVIDEIQKAIKNNAIQKYHFNLFRGLLEKIANFLGYNEWQDCVLGDNKQECIKLINLNSHGKLSDLEYKELSNEEKALFQKTFDEFIKGFKWRV